MEKLMLYTFLSHEQYNTTERMLQQHSLRFSSCSNTETEWVEQLREEQTGIYS